MLRQKTWRAYLFAFGLAGLTAALAQSGAVVLSMPIMAHFFAAGKWNWRKIFAGKKFIVGVAVAALAALFLGYPQFIARPFLGERSAPILSSEHQRPEFSVNNFFDFFYEYFYRAEFLLTFLAILWVIGEGVLSDELDLIAVVPIVLFLLVFGFANVTTGRFALVIVPPFLILGARAWARLDKIRFARYTAKLFLTLQIIAILFLTRIAWGGDTRAEAATYLLAKTSNEKIALTMDPAFAGFVPTPATVDAAKPGPKGAADEMIRQRNLMGRKSRNLWYWDGAADIPKDVRYVLVDSARFEKRLQASGFDLAEIFAGSKVDSFISWGYARPLPFPSLPIVFDLPNYSSLGPNVRVYRKR